MRKIIATLATSVLLSITLTAAPASAEEVPPTCEESLALWVDIANESEALIETYRDTLAETRDTLTQRTAELAAERQAWQAVTADAERLERVADRRRDKLIAARAVIRELRRSR